MNNDIVMDRVYEFNLNGTYSFGDLPVDMLNEIFKDGRVASHLLEPQLTKWFPELRHVKGCKNYDHVHRLNEEDRYDAKNFTVASGCKFMPSGMIGTGRKFNEEVFLFKAENLKYIICDIVDFPKVRVVFKNGKELAQKYPTGAISLTKREELFC
jgi:hypothetical protein